MPRHRHIDASSNKPIQTYEENNQIKSLNILPNEIVDQIFNYLGIADTIALGKTSKRFYGVYERNCKLIASRYQIQIKEGEEFREKIIKICRSVCYLSKHKHLDIKIEGKAIAVYGVNPVKENKTVNKSFLQKSISIFRKKRDSLSKNNLLIDPTLENLKKVHFYTLIASIKSVDKSTIEALYSCMPVCQGSDLQSITQSNKNISKIVDILDHYIHFDVLDPKFLRLIWNHPSNELKGEWGTLDSSDVKIIHKYLKKGIQQKNAEIIRLVDPAGSYILDNEIFREITVDRMQFLLESNIISPTPETLQAALSCKNHELALILAKSPGVDLNARLGYYVNGEIFQSSFLTAAILFGNLELVKYLVSCNCHISEPQFGIPYPNENWKVHSSRATIVNYLKEHGIDLSRFYLDMNNDGNVTIYLINLLRLEEWQVKSDLDDMF